MKRHLIAAVGTLAALAALSLAPSAISKKTETNPDRTWETTVDSAKPAFMVESDGAYFAVEHADTKKSEKTVDGKIEMKGQARTHRFYEITDGFEYEIEYASRPVSNIETLQFAASNDLQFVYQPPLTQEQIDRGSVRPENVVGSYAVYWKNPKPGQSRKFGHIYRPFLIDANGDTEWAEMAMDGNTNTMTIVMPGEWLDKATYPVILDPTFGKTDIGATTDTMPNNYIQVFGAYSPASNGTATSMSLYTTIASVNFKMLIYANNGGTPVGGALLAKTDTCVSVTNNWATCDLQTPLAVTAGTNYFIGIMQQSIITSKADTETETDYYKDGQTFGTEPATFPASPSTDNMVKSLYVTYTATASATPSKRKGVIIIMNRIKSLLYPSVYAWAQ